MSGVLAFLAGASKGYADTVNYQVEVNNKDRQAQVANERQMALEQLRMSNQSKENQLQREFSSTEAEKGREFSREQTEAGWGREQEVYESRRGDKLEDAKALASAELEVKQAQFLKFKKANEGNLSPQELKAAENAMIFGYQHKTAGGKPMSEKEQMDTLIELEKLWSKNAENPEFVKGLQAQYKEVTGQDVSEEEAKTLWKAGVVQKGGAMDTPQGPITDKEIQKQKVLNDTIVKVEQLAENPVKQKEFIDALPDPVKLAIKEDLDRFKSPEGTPTITPGSRGILSMGNTIYSNQPKKKVMPQYRTSSTGTTGEFQ